MNALEVVVASTELERAECFRIRQLVFIEEQHVPSDIELDQHEDTATHFLVQLNNLPVATGRMRQKDSFIKFERIATLKDYRGKGLGKFLMTFMHDFASKNYPSLTPIMHAQESAISFYENLGWVSHGETFYEAGIAHKTLTKPS